MRAQFVSINDIPARPLGAVVVIDVLRAFTAAAWILRAAPSSLVLSPTREEALRIKAELGPGAVAVTDGALDEGFDLGNSPGQIRNARLRGRHVVHCTRNGTVGVHASRHASLVLCAALVNATATATALRNSGCQHVTYVVTGAGGGAVEDRACADVIQALVTDTAPPADAKFVVASSPAAEDLRAGVRDGYPGIHPDDVDLSCEVDTFGFAMVAVVRQGRTVLELLSGATSESPSPSPTPWRADMH